MIGQCRFLVDVKRGDGNEAQAGGKQHDHDGEQQFHPHFRSGKLPPNQQAPKGADQGCALAHGVANSRADLRRAAGRHHIGQHSGAPQDAAEYAEEMRTEGATAEVLSEADRLTFHRQIHEVQVVDEGRQEHAYGKEEAHRVSSQTLFGGPAHLHQRIERLARRSPAQ